MIPHVLTHARTVRHDLNTVFLELVLGTNSRHHEQLGRLEGTRGNDNFAVSFNGVDVARGALDLHAGRLFLVVEDNLLGEGVCVRGQCRWFVRQE